MEGKNRNSKWVEGFAPLIRMAHTFLYVVIIFFSWVFILDEAFQKYPLHSNSTLHQILKVITWMSWHLKSRCITKEKTKFHVWELFNCPLSSPPILINVLKKNTNLWVWQKISSKESEWADDRWLSTKHIREVFCAQLWMLKGFLSECGFSFLSAYSLLSNKLRNFKQLNFKDPLK